MSTQVEAADAQWRVYAHHPLDGYWVMSGDVRVALVDNATSSPRLPKGQGKANARLIAAAPDLLAALMRYVEDDDIGARIASPRYLAARAAIAKAEGK